MKHDQLWASQDVAAMGKNFRNFKLAAAVVDSLEQTLTQQGWQAIVANKCHRQGDHFCVDDILVALNLVKKNK